MTTTPPVTGGTGRPFKPSHKQRQILRQISRQLRYWGWPPTVRELAHLCNLKSSSTVVYHLNKLERKGYLLIDRGKARGLRLTGKGVV